MNSQSAIALPTDSRMVPSAPIDGKRRSVRTGGVILVALAAAALLNHRLAKRAEHNNPPVGRFLEVDGVRLHVLDRGEGPPLVLLHGNGTMIEDFVSSGLVDQAAQSRRVIAFDRPGFGHSSRPRTTIWTPAAQADLLAAALDRLGVSGAIVLGHPWGCAVAVELGRKRPDLVHGLVLASGYYYPTARVDVPALAAPAVPVVGDVCATLSRRSWLARCGRSLSARCLVRLLSPAASPTSPRR